MPTEQPYRWSPFQLSADELAIVADALIADASAPFSWRMAATLHKHGSETGKELLIRIVATLEQAATNAR